MPNLVRSPPFLFTYWNPLAEDSNVISSWFDYVKNTSLAKYTADSIGRYLQQTSGDQINAIDTTGRKICGALYDGFSDLQSNLQNLQSNLSEVSGQLAQVLDQLQGVSQRMDLLLDEAKTSNLLQENMAELLRIPDSQKQRQYHIELGLKFLKNALKDEDLYQDALRELLDAEKLMPSDYFVLHRIGMIYLYVPALGNLDKATDYFSRAAKYAFVESHPDAARLSNILSKSVSQKFAHQAEASTGDIGALAGESYFQAATSLYALARFGDAAKMVEKAVKCQPHKAKYHFFLAKYITRAGNPSDAIPHLKIAIGLIPEMALATIGDFDLSRAQPVLDLLDFLNNKINKKLELGIQRLEKCSEVNAHSDALQWLSSAQESLQNGNYPQKLALLVRLSSTYAKTQQNILRWRYAKDKDLQKNEADSARRLHIFAMQNVAAAQCDLGNYYLDRENKAASIPGEKWNANMSLPEVESAVKMASVSSSDTELATEVFRRDGVANVVLLVRRLRWTYGRAFRVINELERRGVVGNENGTIPRRPDVGLAYELFCEAMRAEAVKWFQKAADQNYAEAQCRLGECYAEGQGVERDKIEAIKWLRKAAEQGHLGAKCALEEICPNRV